MKIIFGLGNPGKDYENTRHNAGFLMLEKVKEKFGFPEFKLEKKFKAETSELTTNGEKIFLIKPQTFMNSSGETVRAVLDFYKCPIENIIIIHDEIDIELGKIRLSADSSSAGHNGVQNIFDTLGTQKVARLRIGIGKSPEEKAACPISAHDYVLGKFSEEELEKLKSIEEKVMEEVKKNIM